MASFNKVRSGSRIKFQQPIKSPILGDRRDNPHAEVLHVRPRSFVVRVEDERQCRELPRKGSDFTLVQR